MTFEQLGQNRGFVLYETDLGKMFTDPAELKIDVLHDRANVFVNQEFRGILSRAESVFSMPLSGKMSKHSFSCSFALSCPFKGLFSIGKFSLVAPQ